MKIKWALPHYSLPLEVESIEEIRKMGLVCVYTGKSLTGDDQSSLRVFEEGEDCKDRGPVRIFVIREGEDGRRVYHLFGVELICHRVTCGIDSSPPDYCKKHEQSIESITDGCTCCSQCCSCGG